MESLKESFTTLAEMFHTKMDEFQTDLKKNSASKAPATTTTLASDFQTFKMFIVAALNTLQQQMEFLRLEVDRQEMRRRRKMLLLHGVPEAKAEDISACVSTAVSKHLDLPSFSSSCIRHSYRLGRSKDNQPRPIVVKFTEISVRDKVWFAKTKFKGTGITQSEFLTKPRHEVFLEARKRFGISNCWTREGFIFVVSSEGNRHRLESLSELESIPIGSVSASAAEVPCQSSRTNLSPKIKDTRLPEARSRRVAKK